MAGFPVARPFLKWAGGKSQLLDELGELMPPSYGRYIEPFLGGGALFFALAPQDAVLADSNPELINTYKAVRDDVAGVLQTLRTFENSEASYYAIREERFEDLDPIRAAARTIYLNRTCFNGLYRVNQSGHFNVPYGKRPNADFIMVDRLEAASAALANAEIVEGDYKTVLAYYADRDALVFLDPPYLPVGGYSDFKRYTKERFYEEDHEDLAEEVERLRHVGCHVLLTHSNHDLVHELYGHHHLRVHSTRRNISSKSTTRKGQDVLIKVRPAYQDVVNPALTPLPAQAALYPSTRYMGSKEKLLPHLHEAFSQLDFESASDIFSGTGVVSYLLKSMGKRVVSNDYMHMGATFTQAMIENSTVTLSQDEVAALFAEPRSEHADSFVTDTFPGIYYSDDDNALIDIVRANIKALSGAKRAIAMAALIRACLKKRPRGIFTYTGMRYDDGRKDLRKGFEEHIAEAVEAINAAVFSNGQISRTYCGDALDRRATTDLVYLDPPYYSPLSDNEYVRRYHFVEGLARDWKGVEMQLDLKTRKFKNYPTPFSSRTGAYEAFDALFRKWRDKHIVLSYSSNSQPTQQEIVELLSKYKSNVIMEPIDYRYSFGNQGHKVGNNRNAVREYLFIAT